MNPNAVLDPKIIEILKQNEQPIDPIAKESNESTLSGPRKPNTLEAFLEITGMLDFPEMDLVTSVNNPDLLEIDDIPVGNVDEIKAILREAAPIDLSALEKCEQRLLDLEGRLRYYSDQVLSETTRTSRLKNKLFHAPPIDDLSARHRAKTEKKLQEELSLQDQLAELQKRKAGYCKFPGFRPGELTELPGQLEAPMLLHRVTKAQDFNPGFRRFWKKAFLSEASIAMLQDIFWWFYIDKFDKTKENVGNQDLLYDRIADSFNSLFLSVHPEIKDKFFSVYCDCLSQGIFAAYHEAFPESDDAFDDDFKQTLCNMVHEWITGIKPPPETFKAWNIKRLEPKFKGPADKHEVDLQQKMIQVAALNKEPQNNLDIEGFHAAVRRMGDGSTSRLGTAPREPSLHREPTALATLPASGHALENKTASRQAQCGTPRKQSKESHQVGPGAEFSRVLFNIQGRSPLVQHYLYMRQLRQLDQVGKKVTRTEILQRPPDRETYRQVINKSLDLSDQMKAEYQNQMQVSSWSTKDLYKEFVFDSCFDAGFGPTQREVCNFTRQEIAKIERKKVQMFHKIESLKEQVRDCRNPHDSSVIADYIQSGDYERKEGLGLMPTVSQARKEDDESDDDEDDDDDYDDEDENQNVK